MSVPIKETFQSGQPSPRRFRQILECIIYRFW